MAAYLDGVAQAQIEDVEVDPFRVEYQFRDGADQADPPTEQDFWVAQGTDGEPLVWDLESGDWVVVVMNADGSAGVSVDAAVAAKVDWLLPLGIGLLIGGFVFLVGGALLVVFGAVGLSRHSAAHPRPFLRWGRRCRRRRRSASPVISTTGSAAGCGWSSGC